MPQGNYVHPLFGLVEFTTESTEWVRGDQIKFTAGFDVSEVKLVQIPQLANIPGSHNGKLYFHSRGHEQLHMVFADIELLGLLGYIKTYGGSFNPRLKKPISGRLSKEPSNHAFGIAIDINSDDGSNGASVAPLAPLFEALGFQWGNSFKDPMHFEVKKFIDHPRSVGCLVSVAKNGKTLELGALNLQGNLVIDTAKAQNVLGFTIVSRQSGRLRLRFQNEERSLPVIHLGDNDFIPLAQAAGYAGFSMSFDNINKSVIII